MTRPGISVTIITLNEEERLGDAIRSVRWADDVLVVDCGSGDRTTEIARELGARVLHNPWKGYGQQKNFAQEQARNDWILNIDADERVPDELAAEIVETVRRADAAALGPRGFAIARKTIYLGRWIRHGGWYPNHVVRLADRRFSRWTEPQVHEALSVQGQTGTLTHALHHYTFAGIEDQVRTNIRYARQGSEDLRGRGERPSLLKLLLKPIGKFIETYFLKLGVLDGLPGFIISMNAAHSMFLKHAFLFEGRLLSQNRENPHR